MQTCETCRHWWLVPHTRSEVPTFGYCNAVPDAYDDRRYERAVAVTVGNGPGSDFKTRPSFGCIVHEPRK